MKPTLFLLILVVLSACLTSTRAAIVEIHPVGIGSIPNHGAVPDGDPSGLSQTLELRSRIGSITDVEVRLDLSSAFAGDVYVYLAHAGHLAVLLNRPGVDAGDPAGYSDSGGFDLVFRDGAANGDVHFYRDIAPLSAGFVPLTGEWEPDGRRVDPVNDSRTALLSGFHGLTASGPWTLFVADLVGGDHTVLNGWSLTVHGSVPEPSGWLLVLVGSVALVFLRARQ